VVVSFEFLFVVVAQGGAHYYILALLDNCVSRKRKEEGNKGSK
jgi:hypothetical protein